jgi:hypothetical protein
VVADKFINNGREMTDKKSWAQNKVIWLISFLAAFFVVKELKTLWFDSQSEQKINQSTSQLMQEKIDEAKKDSSNSGVSAMETIQNNVQKDIDLKIDNAKDANKKIVLAADTLYGAYFLNVKARPIYCEKYGVNMDNFVREYQKVNSAVYQAIYAIQVKDFSNNKVNFDENKLFNSMKDAQLKIVELDTTDMATQFKSNNKDVCKALNQEAFAVAKEMDLRVLQPKLSQIVMAGSKSFK